MCEFFLFKYSLSVAARSPFFFLLYNLLGSSPLISVTVALLVGATAISGLCLLFLGVLGLRCSEGCLVVELGDRSLAVVHGLLSAVASLVSTGSRAHRLL